MSKVIKNSIPSNLIDFSQTSLFNGLVEYYYKTGEVAAEVPASKIIEFIEANELNHTGEFEEVLSCEHPFSKNYSVSIEEVVKTAEDYFDQHFDFATTQYFNSKLAIESEVSHAA